MLHLEGKYDDALSLYTKAIELNPTVPAYYGNRSFCYIKTEYYGCALEDANKALELDKKYVKVCQSMLIHVKCVFYGMIIYANVYTLVFMIFHLQVTKSQNERNCMYKRTKIKQIVTRSMHETL